MFMRKIGVLLKWGVVFFACSCLLFSQKTEKRDVFELSLEELMDLEVVTASSKEETINNAPANIFVITRSEILERGYRTLMDLVRDLPGTTWTSTIGDDNNGTPVIRGMFGNKRLRLMINGMGVDPKNGFGTGWAQAGRFPTSGIDRVEFILGPYASYYGRNTFSGIINVITIRPEKQNESLFGITYGTYNRLQTNGIVASHLGPVELFISLFRNFSKDGIDMVEEFPEEYLVQNRLSHSFAGMETEFAEGVSRKWLLPWDHRELYLNLSHDSGLRLDFQVNHARYAKMGNTFTPLWYVSPPEGMTSDNIFNARLQYRFNLNESIVSTTEITYQDYFFGGKNYYINGNTKWYHQTNRSFAFSEKLHFLLYENNELYMGLNIENNDEGLMNAVFNVQDLPELSRINRQFINVSLQDKIRLFDDRIHLVGGFMLEASDAYDVVFLPRFASLWHMSPKTTLKFMCSSGYITPDPVTIVDQIINENDNIMGTQNLSPETIFTYDFSFIHQVNKNTRITFSVFLNEVRNIIQQVRNVDLPAPYTSTWKNVGESESNGIDISLDWKIPKLLKMFISYSYVKGFFESMDDGGQLVREDRLPVSAMHHFKGGINFYLFKNRLNLYIHNLWLGDRFTLNNTWRGDGLNAYQIACPDYRLKGYNLVDIHVGTTPKFHNNFSISFDVKNLFDVIAFDPTHVDYTISVYPHVRRRTCALHFGYQF